MHPDIDQEMNGSTIDLNIQIEYQDNLTNKWVTDSDNLYAMLLKNNLTIQKQMK